MIEVLKDPSQWLNKATGLPDAILVSAGGDDLVGDQLAIYVDYGGGGLNLPRFQGVLDSVKASYLDLFAFRDIFAKGVPIIGHCYDYAIPNNVHPICTASAWLWPSLSFAGYDYDSGLQVIKQMIDKFRDMLAALAADPANNFRFLTQGIRSRATQRSQRDGQTRFILGTMGLPLSPTSSSSA